MKTKAWLAISVLTFFLGVFVGTVGAYELIHQAHGIEHAE